MIVNCGIRAYQSLKQLSQLPAARAIQRCGRLIHKQQRRIYSQTERIFADLYKMKPATVSKLQDLLLPKGSK
jgi:hypothetical protein